MNAKLKIDITHVPLSLISLLNRFLKTNITEKPQKKLGFHAQMRSNAIVVKNAPQRMVLKRAVGQGACVHREHKVSKNTTKHAMHSTNKDNEKEMMPHHFEDEFFQPPIICLSKRCNNVNNFSKVL